MMRTVLNKHVTSSIRTADTHLVEVDIIRAYQTQCKIIARIRSLIMQFRQTTITILTFKRNRVRSR